MNWYVKSQYQESNIIKYLKMITDFYLKQTNTGLQGTKFKHPDQFFLEKGTFFKSQQLTDQELAIVKEAMKLLTFQIKECYYNSQSLAQRNRKILYVEGYCFAGMIPFAHAWNTINGKVIDTTLKFLNMGKSILGVFPQGWEYFGTDFSIDEIREMWAKYKMAYPIISYEMDWKHLKDNYPEEKEETSTDFSYTNP